MTDDVFDFPLLNRTKLKSFFDTRSRHERIRKITLHNSDGKVSDRYVLLFWLEGRASQSQDEFPVEREIIFDDFLENSAFSEIYVSGALPSAYRKEWFIYPIFQNEPLPKFASKEHWLLYDKHEEAQEPQRDPVPEPEGYIVRRRGEGIQDEVIAYELFQSQKVSHLNIARLFQLDNNLNSGQRVALKMRGKRFCDKGRGIVSQKLQV